MLCLISDESKSPPLAGNPMSAVYAIPATRPGYPGYFLSTPPSSYHSPSWMSYPPEPEDVPQQWAESVSHFPSLHSHLLYTAGSPNPAAVWLKS